MRAWRAWAILLAWILAADIVPAAIAGFGTFPPASLGAQAGYLADATPVLALCIALAFIPLKGEEAAAAPRPLPKPARIVALLVFCAFAAGTAVSLQAFEKANPGQAARSYIATARLAVTRAPHGTVIVDGPTPATVMDPGFFPPPQAFTSTVIGALTPRQKTVRWTPTLHGVVAHPVTFDDRGQLRPVTVEGPGKTRVRGCWTVTSAGTDIRLNGSLYRWPWTARLSYSGPSGWLAVSFGGDWNQVTVPAGRHVVYVPVLGSGGTVSVQFAGDTTRPLCLTAVTVGSLHPDQSGRPIPAAPVPG
jgi:hypothetical protein